MEIDKLKLERIINNLESSEGPFYEACKELKALIEPEKWEPKEHYLNNSINILGSIITSHYSSEIARQYGNEWRTKELAETARSMNKRNQLILQAKTEIEAKDGDYIITYDIDNGWKAITSKNAKDNPELTFETEEQAEIVIKMVGLNE